MAFDHVDDELGVLPVFVLRLADVKRAAADLAEKLIPGADGQFARQIAICSTVVATAAGLVKHQGAVFLLEERDQFESRRGGGDFINHAWLQ